MAINHSINTGRAWFGTIHLREVRKEQSAKRPRRHQEEALAALSGWYRAEVGEGATRGGILTLPTGGGKTFTAVRFLCEGPLSDGYKVLWLAHTHHLLEQAYDTFFVAGEAGKIREPREALRLRVVSGTPGHLRPAQIQEDDDVVIGTLQTMAKAVRELDQVRRFLDSAKGKLVVVFDEAHHAPAKTFRDLIRRLQEERGAIVLGLTATPTYSDKRKQGWLKTLFPQEILYQVSLQKLIFERVLATPVQEEIHTNEAPEFDAQDITRWQGGNFGDIPEDVIDALATRASRNALIANTYVQGREKYQRTIIFADRWYQCQALVEMLRERGVRAEAVYSHREPSPRSAEERQGRDRDHNNAALERFRNGELDVLVNVRMLTEGTDLPDATSVFLTRQTTSKILLTQMVGRALRGPAFGGTEKAYIVSFVDEWQQSIAWAEWDPWIEGGTGVDEPERERLPVHWISIALIQRLAREIDRARGGGDAPTAFVQNLPVGWYHLAFDVVVGDDVTPQTRVLLVFADEKAAFARWLEEQAGALPSAFEDPEVNALDQATTLSGWRGQYFAAAGRDAMELERALFDLARHLGQSGETPTFVEYESRDDHDLDELARQNVREDLRTSEIKQRLEYEYRREDRQWSSLFTTIEQFRRQYYIAHEWAESGSGGVIANPPPPGGNTMPKPIDPAVVSDEIKRQIKERDGWRCLACGAGGKGVRLQVDHIDPVYRGGKAEVYNLQTLCSRCNNLKRDRHAIDFRRSKTPLSAPPSLLEAGESLRGADAANRERWSRYLRQVLNLTYQAAVVGEVTIGAKGPGYYNWKIELERGNPPAYLKPHLSELVIRIQDVRAEGGKPRIESLEISAPGETTLTWPQRGRGR